MFSSLTLTGLNKGNSMWHCGVCFLSETSPEMPLSSSVVSLAHHLWLKDLMPRFSLPVNHQNPKLCHQVVLGQKEQQDRKQVAGKSQGHSGLREQLCWVQGYCGPQPGRRMLKEGVSWKGPQEGEVLPRPMSSVGSIKCNLDPVRLVCCNPPHQKN